MRCLRRILKIKFEDVRQLMIKYVQGRNIFREEESYSLGK